MKLRNLIVVSLAALMAIVSCKETEENLGMPSIKLDGNGTMTFETAGGDQQINLTATRDWMVETDAEWIMVSPESGKASATPQTVTVTALENKGMDRTADVKFTIGMSFQTLTVNQTGPGGSAEKLVIYTNDFDKTISSKVNDKWPYLDQFDGWMNAAGTGAADVVYKFKSASARASSDNNNIWLPKTGAYFSVQGIALNGTADLKLSFNVICGSPGSYKKSFSSSVFKVYVSSDNAKWVELACDVTANDKEFDNAVTTFSVPANTASLSIAFEKIADETDGYRIDDVKLAAASAAGTAVDFSQGVSKDFGEGNAPDSGQDPQPPVGEATLMTISEVLASGSALASGSYIEAVVISDRSLNNLTSKKGLYVQDATAGLQFYLAENHEFNFGDKVKIDLSGIKVGEYNGAVQISGLALANISVISTGNTVEPKKVTVADFLANKYEGQYVAIEGVQVVEEDLARTFVEGEAHTSINVETADGKTFAIFSSKYASYGAEKVPQGSGTIKGISSISKGAMQIIFAKSSDYAGLTGERFGDNAGGDEGGNEGENPGGEVTPPEGGDEGGNEGDNPGGEGDNPGGEVTPPADEASPMTIAEVLASGSSALASGSFIEAVVISDRSLNNLTSKKGLYVQDATAGLQFYLAENHEFNFGDKVKIDLSGITVGAYNGAVQVSGLALANISVISSGNAVDPKKVTVADFLANKYEGQYVAIEGVQVVKADLSKTFVEGESHTSINLETADGKTFAVFSSKYATYGDETVPQGSGTIKGISSINNGAMQIIFAQASDYAGLTGERFGDNAGGDEGGNEGENPGGEGDNPGGEVTPPAGGDEGGNEGSDGSATTTVVFDWSTLATETNQAYTGTTVDGVTLTGSDIATNKAGQLRIYASKGVITLNSGTKKMTKIEFTFTSAEYTGVLEAEGYSDGIWTGNASEVTFSNTGKQARVKKMVITLTE